MQLEKLNASGRSFNSSDILIAGSIRNHDSFYRAIAVHHNISFDSISHFCENPSLGDYLMLLSSLLKGRIRNIYLDDHLSLVASVIFICASRLFSRETRVRVCIHNANKWIFGNSSITIRDFIKKIIRRIIVITSYELIVVTTDIKQYLGCIYSKKTIQVIPFRLQEGSQRSREDELIIFCIPGNVDSNRRDYLPALNAISSLENEGYQFEVHLLGIYNSNSVSKEVKSKISEILENKSKALKLYYDHISPERFDEIISKSTALIANLNPYVVANTGIEIYGITKETGVRVLADAYGITCLTSPRINPGRQRHLYVTYFTSRDLLDLMRSVIDRKSKGV